MYLQHEFEANPVGWSNFKQVVYLTENTEKKRNSAKECVQCSLSITTHNANCIEKRRTGNWFPIHQRNTTTFSISHCVMHINNGNAFCSTIIMEHAKWTFYDRRELCAYYMQLYDLSGACASVCACVCLCVLNQRNGQKCNERFKAPIFHCRMRHCWTHSLPTCNGNGQSESKWQSWQLPQLCLLQVATWLSFLFAFLLYPIPQQCQPRAFTTLSEVELLKMPFKCN